MGQVIDLAARKSPEKPTNLPRLVDPRGRFEHYECLRCKATDFILMKGGAIYCGECFAWMNNIEVIQEVKGRGPKTV